MSSIWKVWKWPEFLHGKGHNFYKSEEAKEIYAKQLISLSEKVLWLLLAPIFGYFLQPDSFEQLQMGIASTAILCVGLYFRHQGLRIIDEIKTDKIKVFVSNENR